MLMQGMGKEVGRTNCLHSLQFHDGWRMIKTVLQTIQDGAAYLEKRGVENGRLNMEHLLARVLQCKRMQLYLWFDRPLVEGELAPLRDLTMRRGKREPLQHLLGTVEFYGREFLCDARALIPRPETEELVEKIVAMVRSAGKEPARILDVGAGSGVIGLSLALAWPEVDVTLADISPDALQLAGANAAKHGREVRLVQTDLWAALPGERFSLVSANLPYIPSVEIAQLEAEVQKDPSLALDGGTEGHEIMIRFIAGLPEHLERGAVVAMEIGPGQGALLQEALEHAGLASVQVLNDYSGRERFVFAVNS